MENKGKLLGLGKLKSRSSLSKAKFLYYEPISKLMKMAHLISADQEQNRWLQVLLLMYSQTLVLYAIKSNIMPGPMGLKLLERSVL